MSVFDSEVHREGVTYTEFINMAVTWIDPGASFRQLGIEAF